MVKKRCSECNQNSYSAFASGKWLCPYCEADMTLVQPEDINIAKVPPEEPAKKLFCPFRCFMWPSKKMKPGNVSKQMQQ